MSRILLFAALIMAGTALRAQVAITPVKAAEKTVPAAIDFTKIGMPMPPFRLMVYEDTTRKKEEVSKFSTPATEGRKKRGGLKPTNAAEIPSQRKFLTERDFDNGANLFVMLFNPNCSHCEDETQMLQKNIFYFKKSKIVMMANPVMWEYLPNFNKSFHIDEYSTFTLGVDSSDYITKTFLYSALPQINVYNKERKLIKIFSGEASIDSLKGYIE